MCDTASIYTKSWLDDQSFSDIYFPVVHRVQLYITTDSYRYPNEFVPPSTLCTPPPLPRCPLTATQESINRNSADPATRCAPRIQAPFSCISILANA